MLNTLHMDVNAGASELLHETLQGESLMSSHLEPNRNPWGSGQTEDGGAVSAEAGAVLCVWLVLILTANGEGPLTSYVSRQAAGGRDCQA